MKRITIIFAAVMLLSSGLWSCKEKEESETSKVEWVDLGLPSGLLWAKCNVGATTPEGYGDYLAWGEITPSGNYRWLFYRYADGEYNRLTKYCSISTLGLNGYHDNLTILQPADDAATACYGSSARTPTKEEWEEMKNNTTAEWTTENGVAGRRFTGRNGNSIFLPASGYGNMEEIENKGVYGGYWSSTLGVDYPYGAWGFGFYQNQQGMSLSERSVGFSVRAVSSVH